MSETGLSEPQKLRQPPSPSFRPQQQEAKPCHQHSHEPLLYCTPGSTNQGREFPRRVLTALSGCRPWGPQHSDLEADRLLILKTTTGYLSGAGP